MKDEAPNRRQELLEQMRQLQARISARNTDLGEAEVEALADEVTREAIESLVEQGKVRFDQAKQ